MSSQGDHVTTLKEMEKNGTDIDTALKFFDSLPPVKIEEMIGNWKGGGINTKHPMDGVLETLGWHGKRYKSADDAFPMVMEGKDGKLFTIDPSKIPMEQLLGANATGKLDEGHLKDLMTQIASDQPAARLRMVEYRGTVSGTMIYDGLPIFDHFRRVDKDNFIGAMDLRGVPQPFMFCLHRET